MLRRAGRPVVVVDPGARSQVGGRYFRCLHEVRCRSCFFLSQKAGCSFFVFMCQKAGDLSAHPRSCVYACFFFFKAVIV